MTWVNGKHCSLSISIRARNQILPQHILAKSKEELIIEGGVISSEYGTPCLLQIINGRLPTRSTNPIATVVEVASGKGHA